MLKEIIYLLIAIFTIFGGTGFYIYLCKYFTIKRVQELELQLSKIENITDEELNLLESVREFLKNPVEESNKESIKSD